jgi:hypothetical protein
MTNKESGDAFLRKAFLAYQKWEPSWYSIGTKKPEFPFKTNLEFIAYVDKLAPAFTVSGVRKGSWIESWGKSLIDNKITSVAQDKIITATLDKMNGQYPKTSIELQTFGEEAVKQVGGFKAAVVSGLAQTGTQLKEAGTTALKIAAVGASTYVIVAAGIGLLIAYKWLAPRKASNPRRRRH